MGKNRNKRLSGKQLFESGAQPPPRQIVGAKFVRLPVFSIDKNCVISTKGSSKVSVSFSGVADEYFIIQPFRCDGASIPQAARSICSKFKFCNAGIAHDFLYESGIYTRKESDLIFYHLAKSNKSIWTSTAWAAYRVVRAFGSQFYKPQIRV